MWQIAVKITGRGIENYTVIGAADGEDAAFEKVALYARFAGGRIAEVVSSRWFEASASLSDF